MRLHDTPSRKWLSHLSRTSSASLAVLAACTVAHFSNHLYTGALSPFMPIIQDELTLNLTQVGLITSTSVFTMTASHLFVGYLSDRGLRDFLISMSILATAAVVLLTSLSETILFLIVCQALLGLAASSYHPCAFPALTEKFPDSSRATATGIQAAGGLVGMTVVPALGVTLLVLLGGWRQSLFVLGLLGFVLFSPAFALMRYSRRERSAECKSVITDENVQGWSRSYVLVLVVSSLRGIPFRCTVLMMPVYLVARFGYQPVWAGSLTTVMLASGLLAELMSAPVSDKLRRRVPFIIASNGFMTFCLILLNTPLDETSLVLVLVGIGFSYFLGEPANEALQTEVSPAKSRGVAFGLIFSIGAFPGALAPLVFGSLGDAYGLSASILFLVTTTALAAAVSVLLREAHQNADAAKRRQHSWKPMSGKSPNSASP